MGTAVGIENIPTLAVGSTTTVTLASTAQGRPTRITVGGQQYVLSSSITLNAATVGANGLDSGALGAVQAWYVYAIVNQSSLALALVASQTAPTSGPTMPSGYGTAYKCIGMFTTSQSGLSQIASTGGLSAGVPGTLNGTGYLGGPFAFGVLFPTYALEVWGATTDTYSTTAVNQPMLYLRNTKAAASNNFCGIQFNATDGGSNGTVWEIGLYTLGGSNASVFSFKAQNGLSTFTEAGLINRDGSWSFGPSSGTANITHQMISNSTGTVEHKIFSPSPGSSAATLSIRNSSGTAANDGIKIVHGGGITKFQDLNSTTFAQVSITNAGAWSFIPQSASSALTIYGYNGSPYSVSGAEGLVVGANLSSTTYFGILVVNGRGGGQAANDWYLRFTDSVTQRGGIQVSNATTVAFIATSDARLKTDVEDFSGAIDMMRAIKPRHFTWIENGERDMGFLAQELKNIYPSAVAGDPEGDVTKNPMGVDYGKITPLLAAAIKDLINANDALTARVAALEAK